MTAAVGHVERVACPDCDGAGGWSTGVREPDTGMWVAQECGSCEATGMVDASFVSRCECCGTVFWTGDGCNHAGVRCTECAGACGECKDETQGQLFYEVFRGSQMLGGER